MAIISLGTIDKRLFFTLFGAIFKLISNIILYHSEVKMTKHPCILGINAGIGLSLAFVPFMYIKMKSRIYTNPKSSQAIVANVISDRATLYNSTKNIIKNNSNKKKYFYILMVALLDFAQKFLTFFYPALFLENFWIFDSFLLLIFSFLILKSKVYSHHLYAPVHRGQSPQKALRAVLRTVHLPQVQYHPYRPVRRGSNTSPLHFCPWPQ